jgi:hypothetical protein
MDHVTAVFEVPLTVGVKVAVWLPSSEAEDGPTVSPTGINVTVAVALSAEFAALDAVTVTVCWLAIVAGA